MQRRFLHSQVNRLWRGRGEEIEVIDELSESAGTPPIIEKYQSWQVQDGRFVKFFRN